MRVEFNFEPTAWALPIGFGVDNQRTSVEYILVILCFHIHLDTDKPISGRYKGFGKFLLLVVSLGCLCAGFVVLLANMAPNTLFLQQFLFKLGGVSLFILGLYGLKHIINK
jgi:hypothetical protein